MQARAVFEAACDLAATGKSVFPEIMIPLVGIKKELDLQADLVRKTAAAVFAEKGKKIAYTVGTMIEVPRAAMTAGEIAQTAEFCHQLGLDYVSCSPYRLPIARLAAAQAALKAT